MGKSKVNFPNFSEELKKALKLVDGAGTGVHNSATDIRSTARSVPKWWLHPHSFLKPERGLRTKAKVKL